MANGEGKLYDGDVLYEGQFYNNVPHGYGR